MPFNQFKPEHIVHLAERDVAMERLERLGDVWIGPDIAIKEPTVIPPEELVADVGFVINKRDIPNINITQGMMSSLQLSVRSFFAQAGIDATFYGTSLSGEMLEQLKAGENTVIPIDIINHGQRAVKLEGNVLRFFWANDRKRLRGSKLLNALKTGEFFVEGVEGEDWFLGGNDIRKKITTTSENADKGLCVVVRLKPQRYYIPYAPEPIRKNSALGTREDLSALLKPIPAGLELRFEIGETPRIKLGQDIVAVINTGAEKSQKHISSPLVDSGSDWPIRTETLHGLKYVEFFLYKK